LDLWFYPVGLVLLFFRSFFHLLIDFVLVYCKFFPFYVGSSLACL
jgi:hypothetical protein